MFPLQELTHHKAGNPFSCTMGWNLEIFMKINISMSSKKIQSGTEIDTNPKMYEIYHQRDVSNCLVWNCSVSIGKILVQLPLYVLLKQVTYLGSFGIKFELLSQSAVHDCRSAESGGP